MQPKIAIVTGAASGMGREVCTRLAAGGTTVAAVDRDAVGLKQVADGTRVHAYECDVTDDAQVHELAAQIIAELGPIDRLVCAAGIGVSGAILDSETPQVRRVMEVNYFGIAHWVHAVAPAMVQRGSGELVLFASLAGWVPAMGMGAYCASKFAVVGYAETLHRELAPHRVKVLTVCPPAVDTPLLHDLMGEGGLSPRAVKYVKPITPATAVDSIQPALDKNRIYAFPGRGSSMLWRMRRFSPGLSWFLIRKLSGL